MVSRGNQRILYQVEAAIESIFDHVGGQSILIRAVAGTQIGKISTDIIQLARLQNFQVCQGYLSTLAAQLEQPTASRLTSSIISCLTSPGNFSDKKLTRTLRKAQKNPQSDEQQIPSCLDSIKRMTEVSPLLLFIKNIDVAGKQVISLLVKLVLVMGDSAALLVMTSNFEGVALDPAWRGAMHNAPLTTIDLSPFECVC